MRKLGLSLGYGADEMQEMKCEVRWLSRKSARLVAFCLFQVIKEAIMWELAQFSLQPGQMFIARQGSESSCSRDAIYERIFIYQERTGLNAGRV